jgi:hypothetical protein
MQVTRPISSSSEYPSLSAPQPTNTLYHSFPTQCYVQRVTNILSDMDIVAPERVHLELLIKVAFKAQQMFFAAALFHPDSNDSDHFFDEFVRLCARPALAQ